MSNPIINVNALKELIKKATLNNTIPNVQLIFTADRMKAKMKGPDHKVVLFIDTPNDVITNMVDEIEFNFEEPYASVIPFLNLTDAEEVPISIDDKKMVMKSGRQSNKIFFTSSRFVSVCDSKEPNMDVFYEMNINEYLMETFGKIKKIAAKYGKIYFLVENGKFIVETTDRLNTYSNGIKFEIDAIEKENLVMCYDFKNFNNLLSVISGREEEFTAKFSYISQSKAGMIEFMKNDNSEKYYLITMIEER